MKYRLRVHWLACLLLLCVGCTERQPPSQMADIIFFNGKIITMEGDSATYTGAIAVKADTILFTGKEAAAMAFKGDSTKLVDLQGQCLLPGFIDAHGHVSQYAMVADMANLMPEPYGDVMSVPDLQNKLRKYIEEKKIPAGMPVVGNGYDDAIMKEHRHPTADELDAVSTTHPVYIMHTSGHMGVANSRLLSDMKITYDTPNPTGGVIGKNRLTKKLTGKMEENANIMALLFLEPKLPKPDAKHKFDALLKAEQEWFANGETTICDGRVMQSSIDLFKEASDKGLLRGDFIVLPDYDGCKDNLASLKKYYNKYDGRFKIGAIKMTFDGSPQGKSAWLTQPYLVPPEGESSSFKGHPIYTHEAAMSGLKDILEHGMPAHIHCNGDAAIDEGLNLFDTLKQLGLIKPDMRNVLIHSQVCRPDQVPRFKQIGIMPSWFPTHCYLWGDWHLQSVLGPERANHISPLMDGLNNGIMFTIHHDAPVTPPDLLTAMYSAVNRRTRSGVILGAGQRIPPYQALKAITINVAWQWSEENKKGSLKAGKLADLVILDKDPLTVDAATIKDIRVMETYKNGKLVYKR